MGHVPFEGDDANLLDLIAGAPVRVEQATYDHIGASIESVDSVCDGFIERQRPSNELRRIGINVVQEMAVVSQKASQCANLHHQSLFQDICVCRALHDHGLPVPVKRHGPEWVASGGSEMLEPLGLCIRRILGNAVRQPGRYIIDDGHGHAFALWTGDWTIISFEHGTPKLMATHALDMLVDEAYHGNKKIFGIQPFDIWRPFMQGGWTPPWRLDHNCDALCGGFGRRAKLTIKKRPAKITKTKSWPPELIASVHKEVAFWQACASDMTSHTEFGGSGSWRCPMCIAREFTEKKKLRHHFERYHVGNSAGAISMKLQQEVAYSWDRAVMRSGVKKMCTGGGDANPGNLINSCAKVMRLDLEQSRSWSKKKDFGQEGTPI
jgi:hypothetical protein